jgi:hypothetical protein
MSIKQRDLSELVSAVDATLREALDRIDVHPCDSNDDTVRAKGLPEELKRLYDIREKTKVSMRK